MTGRLMFVLVCFSALVFFVVEAKCQESVVKKDLPGNSKELVETDGSGNVKAKTMNTGQPVLTAEDKFAARTAQLETSQTYAQLQNTNEFRAYQASAQRQQQFMAGLYSKYKLDTAKFAICDGPAPGTCEGVAKGEMEIRAVKPKEAEVKK